MYPRLSKMAIDILTIAESEHVYDPNFRRTPYNNVGQMSVWKSYSSKRGTLEDLDKGGITQGILENNRCRKATPVRLYDGS